jgi:Kef-type K+ transport system membrane component KefB
MFDLCNPELKKTLDKYFGVVNKGFHSHRIFNIAYVDVIMTIIVAVFLAWIMNWNYLKTIVGMFVLGIILHRMFCVRTTLDKFIFPSYN